MTKDLEKNEDGESFPGYFDTTVFTDQSFGNTFNPKVNRRPHCRGLVAHMYAVKLVTSQKAESVTAIHISKYLHTGKKLPSFVNLSIVYKLCLLCTQLSEICQRIRYS